MVTKQLSILRRLKKRVNINFGATGIHKTILGGTGIHHPSFWATGIVKTILGHRNSQHVLLLCFCCLALLPCKNGGWLSYISGSPLDVMACPHLGETQRKIKTLIQQIEIITHSVRLKALPVEIRGAPGVGPIDHGKARGHCGFHRCQC